VRVSGQTGICIGVLRVEIRELRSRFTKSHSSE
jgi:hypothetical protein